MGKFLALILMGLLLLGGGFAAQAFAITAADGDDVALLAPTDDEATLSLADEPTTVVSPAQFAVVSTANSTEPPEPSAPAKPRDATSSTPGGKVIYLTFDDGPSKPYTAQVLDLLARYHARATFFVVGRNVKAYPELVRAIHSAGHVLGNHTYDHVWLNRISHAKFVSQVERTQAVLGHLASSCMRPPNGGTNRNTRPYAAALGLQVVMWNIDPRDWSRPGAARIAARILAQVKPRMTVLMHDGGGNRSQTVAALEVVLRELTQRGYRFEPEPQCKRATPETSHGF